MEDTMFLLEDPVVHNGQDTYLLSPQQTMERRLEKIEERLDKLEGTCPIQCQVPYDKQNLAAGDTFLICPFSFPARPKCTEAGPEIRYSLPYLLKPKKPRAPRKSKAPKEPKEVKAPKEPKKAKKVTKDRMKFKANGWDHIRRCANPDCGPCTPASSPPSSLTWLTLR